MKFLERLFGQWYHIPGVKFFLELFLVILPVAFTVRTFVFGLYQVPSCSMETTLLEGERFVADKLTYWFRKPVRGEIIAFNAPDKSVTPKGFQYSTNSFKNFFERYVWGPDNWTKRIIGIPGDHMRGAIENGRTVVYRNGEKLDERSYINRYPLIAIWKNQTHSDLKSYDPAKPWQEQEFYSIDPNTIIRNRETNEPFIYEPGAPLSDGIDEFDIHLGPNQYWVMGDNRLGSDDSRSWGPLDGKLIHGKILFRLWSSDSNESWWFMDLLKHPIDFWKKLRYKRSLQFVG